MKDEWKSVIIILGALFVITHGLLMMLMWPADNLGSMELVGLSQFITWNGVMISHFINIGAISLFGSFVVDGTGQIVLDDLQCTGSESRLIDCPHNGLGNHNCDHSKDAGIRCVPGMTIKARIVH